MRNIRLQKILFGVLMAGLMVSCMGMEESDPSSLKMPQVKTFEVKDNGSLVFELKASVDKNLTGRIAECGFYYGKDKNLSDANKIECKMLGGSFSADVTLREYSKTFYACSYISNGIEGNEICSDPKKITVKELGDYVAFGEAAVVSYDRTAKVATVSISYEVKNGVEVTAGGLCYGPSKDLSVNGNHLTDPDFSSGSATYEIPEIETGKTYYVRPYLYDGDELAYGEVSELNVYAVPLVETAEVSGVTDNSAVCGGKITDDGGMEIIAKGVVWSTDPEPIVDMSAKTDDGVGIGQFESVLTELLPETKYYVRAYATNSRGTAYGETREFTTGELRFSKLKDILEYPDETQARFEAVVAAVTRRGFLVSDEENNILYVYAGSAWERNVEVGNIVDVIGKIGTYYNNRELSMESVSVTGTSAVPASDAITLTSENLSDFATAGHSPCKIELTGDLMYDSPFYEMQVGDSPVVVGLTFPVGNMSAYVGKIVKVTGYYLWTSESQDGETVVSIVDTEISVIGNSGNLNSSGEMANSYIVSKSGSYKFKAVKGNSSKSVGLVNSVEVLWESFGTSTTPNIGDLIKSVSYSGHYIVFHTADIFKEGNAVIAAKDASGTILWSWHIWLTDEPGKCVYANNAGTMMDRNLGATSATPGDVGALGLLYQWGRKDPFLGSSRIDYFWTSAESTIDWPDEVDSSPSCGTISYAIQHPTTCIDGFYSPNGDWLYGEDDSTDNTRWQSKKTLYDPCPAGWRVPDGGDDGVWAKAGFCSQSYDSSNNGILFNTDFSSPATWYPAVTDFYTTNTPIVHYDSGEYWSVTPCLREYNLYKAYYFGFRSDGQVYQSYYLRDRLRGVRCLKE